MLKPKGAITMEEKVVKMGVVGLRRGRLIKNAFGAKHFDITAVCDRAEIPLRDGVKMCEEAGYKVQGFDNYDDFIANADIDAVLIATDAVCHVPYVIKALEAGKHVLSEIPAINSVEEARMLKEAVKAHPHLKYMNAENACYWTFIQSWKEMYQNGKLGEAVYAESEYIHSGDYRNFKKPANPDHWRLWNPTIKYLTHNLGPLLYILDDKCVSVSCMGSDVVYNPYAKVTKTDAAIFKTEKGAVIKILISFGAYHGFDHNFSIFGTRGTLETDITKPLEKAHTFARFADVPGTLEEKMDIPLGLKKPNEPWDEHGGADRKMVLDFIRCIIEDAPSPIDVDLAINMALPGIIAAESAANGGQVMQIPEI